MTRRSHPDNEFVAFGGYKLEIDKNIFAAFTTACAWFGSKRSDILRLMINDFILETEAAMRDDLTLPSEDPNNDHVE